MSEQLIDNSTTNGGTHPAFPFLTGHGGSNQVVLFGYLGLRVEPDDMLHVDPNLPPQIPYLKYRTFYWRGWPISAWSNYTHTTISRACDTPALGSADNRFASKPITVSVGPDLNSTMYRLPVQGSLVIPNRQVGSTNTIAGNLVQCQPVDSLDSYQPGQFPVSVNDGASSTKWQPSLAANWSSITVSLGDEAGSTVTGFAFDWAQAPPVNATVIFHNESLQNAAVGYYPSSDDSNYTVAASLTNITLSNPYSAESTNLDAIAIPMGNTTNMTLSSPITAAKYASLFIIGNQGLDEVDIRHKNGTGATVAEWAILGQSNNQTSGAQHKTRKLGVRAATIADSGLLRRRRQFLSQI